MAKVLCAALLLVFCAEASASPGKKIAVTDLRSVQGVAPGTATILSEIVASEVARAGWHAISQSDISAMLGFEKQKKMLGCSEDSSCLAEIGGALGVDYVLAGQVGQIGTRFRIALFLVDPKKSDVAARAGQFCDQNEDALARAAVSTVRELLGAIQPPGPLAATKAAPSRAAPQAGAEEAPTSTAGSGAPYWYAGTDLLMLANVGMGAGTSYGSALDERSGDKPFGLMVRGGQRRSSSWSFEGMLGAVSGKPYEGRASSSLPGIGLEYAILSVGANAVWVPVGNRYFSVAAGTGLAISRVHVWLTYQDGHTLDAWDTVPGPYVSLDLRFEYPVGPVKVGATMTGLTTVINPKNATVSSSGTTSYFTKAGVLLYPLLAGLSVQYGF